tara:strand:- start:8680 stop:8841 length:162 start_codon:yes stop_codon:yes gene_type:complete
MKGILVFTAFAVVMFSAWLLSRAGLIGGTRTTILRDIPSEIQKALDDSEEGER